MASPMPGMVTTWTWGEAGSSAKAGGQQFPQAPLGVLAVTDLGHEIDDQGLGHGTAEGRDRLLGGLVQRLACSSER